MVQLKHPNAMVTSDRQLYDRSFVEGLVSLSASQAREIERLKAELEAIKETLRVSNEMGNSARIN